MAHRLERKRTPGDGLGGRSDAPPGTDRPTLAHRSITRLHRGSSFVGISSPGVTAACHAQGGAKPLHGVGRPPRRRQPTVTPPASDAPETSPFRRTGHSKRWLDPRRVTACRGRTPGIETPVVRSPRTSRVGSVSRRLGRRAASAYAGWSGRRVVAGVRRGGQSEQRGPGRRRTEATRGHAPGNKPRPSRSPSSPQLGCPLPPPARCLRTATDPPRLPSSGVSSGPVVPRRPVTVRCHSRRQGLPRVERRPPLPQVVHRPPDPRLQERVGLPLAPLPRRARERGWSGAAAVAAGKGVIQLNLGYCAVADLARGHWAAARRKLRLLWDVFAG